MSGQQNSLPYHSTILPSISVFHQSFFITFDSGVSPYLANCRSFCTMPWILVVLFFLLILIFFNLSSLSTIYPDEFLNINYFSPLLYHKKCYLILSHLCFFGYIFLLIFHFLQFPISSYYLYLKVLPDLLLLLVF